MTESKRPGDPSLPMEPTLRRWRIHVLTATWLSYAGFYFCRKAFGIVKAPMKETLGVTDFALAHIWTAYLIAYTLGQFLTAWLGRRVACRVMLLVGMCVSVIANVSFGQSAQWAQSHAAANWILGAPSAILSFEAGPAAHSAYWWLMIMMVINGFAQATGWASNVGILANWTYREERGTLMAVWATCYQIGSIAAKAFAAFMFGWLGLAWSFWGASIVLFAVWIYFYFYGQENPESVGLHFVESIEVKLPETTSSDDDPSTSTPDAAASESIVSSEDAQKTVLRFIFAMGMIYFCFKFIRYAFDSWAALLLKEKFVVATTTAGYLSTVYDWIGFLGVVVGGVLSDRLFKSLRAPMIFWMTTGMFAATILFWLWGSTSLVWFVVCLGLIGFMSMGPDSLLSGVGAIDVGSRRMAVFAAGVINGLGSIGPIVQEEAIGWLKTYWGFHAVLILLVIISALAFVGTGMLWRISHLRQFKL